MSATWYECKVKYRKLDDSGAQKMTTEAYLVDALSYTEAETRINEEMSSYISEEFKITNIKMANFAEIHPFENSDRWFKTKVSLIAFDEESGKERKSNMYLLVQANDIKEAFDSTNAIMKDTMGEYSIPAISESLIMDVFPYFTGEEEQLEKFRAIQSETLTDSEIPNEADDQVHTQEVVVDEVENEEVSEEVETESDFENKEYVEESEGEIPL
ncbi:DUF4494 domain-containing protein [Aquimarina aquimarini]|uniref:DUF4494 domain-containing protein n=1 Tax=Aquimarina aquimarini TaxID=1191734 RepID=UPI000D55B284|nr:DUF4494 domain-containing protein [Aquimarina aquimarini]